jgi:hypothetical protein
MASTAAVWTASYAAPAASVVRRTVASETVTPVKKANASAACAKGIQVPKRTMLSGHRGVSWPGNNANSSSRGEKPDLAGRAPSRATPPSPRVAEEGTSIHTGPHGVGIFVP